MKILKKILAVVAFLLLTVLAFIAAAVMGYMMASAFEAVSGENDFITYGVILLGLLLSIAISVVVHEAGHLVFGLLSGYGFSSFRIGSFMWIKQDGKIKFRRFSLAGTGGQCLMTPPEIKNGKIPVVLYNLGGVIMNFILSAVLILVYIFAPYVPVLFECIVFLLIISFVGGLTNGIPMAPGGMPNDGMNALALAFDPASAIAFRNQLLMNAENAKGTPTSEMPPEWFTLPENANMQNVHCASIAVFAASRTMNSLDFASAEREIKALLDSDCKMASVHRGLLACNLVCCRLILKGDKAEISSILTIKQQKFMQSMKNFPDVLCTEYIITLIRDKNVENAEKIKQKFEKMAKTYPYPQDIESARDIMKCAENIKASK